MSFSKSILKSRSTAKTHKSLNLISDIVLRVFVLISFILLNVLPHVVDETGKVDYLCSFRTETVLVRAFVCYWTAGGETQGERLPKARKSQTESLSRQK
jgi:hypothetical protein